MKQESKKNISVVHAFYPSREQERYYKGEITKHVMRAHIRVSRTGDMLSIRQWLGRPYHSESREHACYPITRASVIRITSATASIMIDKKWHALNRDALARDTGFQTFDELVQSLIAHQSQTTLFFTGVLLEWDASPGKEEGRGND